MFSLPKQADPNGAPLEANMTNKNETPDESVDLPAQAKIKKALLERILSGQLASGERISENQIATEFSVSRGPVREALRSLEQSRLVEVFHNKGVFVRKIDVQEVLHLYDLRAAIAYMAGKLLARRATADQIKLLYAHYELMEEQRQLKDTVRYAELNEQFHSLLMRFAGNPRLIEWSEGLDRELRLFLRGGFIGPSRLKVSNEQHLVIIQKIDEGDAQAAGIAFEEHVTSGKVRALDSIVAEVPRNEATISQG